MDNSQTGFPVRTSDDVTLSDGRVVHVRTLNNMLREEATRASQWSAQKVCQKIRPNGEDYDLIISDWASRSKEEQADYLAAHEYWLGNLSNQAIEKYPMREAPEKGDLSELKYTDESKVWEEETEQIKVKRGEFERKLFEEYRDRQLKVQPKTRVDRCVNAFFVKEFAVAYAKAWMLNTLLKCCRKPEDHGLFFFRNIQEIVDMENDRDRDLLWEKYEELDGIRVAEIPTSPDAS